MAAANPELPLSSIERKLSVKCEGQLATVTMASQQVHFTHSILSAHLSLKVDHCYVPPGIGYSGGRSGIIGKGFVSSSVGWALLFVKWDSSLFSRNGSQCISDIKSIYVPNNTILYCTFCTMLSRSVATICVLLI